MADLGQGQRDLAEVVKALVAAIDDLTVAQTALHDELARLRAEAGVHDRPLGAARDGDRDA
jgi:hypothetical protein